MSTSFQTSGSGERDAVVPELRELAAELLPNSHLISKGLTDHLLASIPELRDGDDELAAETLASSHSNIDQILRLLKAGVGADELTVPIEAAEWVRGLVRRGIALPTLLRAYRLGHGWLWDHLSQLLTEREDEIGALAVARDQASAYLFTYIDRISGVLVEAYGTEQERVARSAEQLRAETVRSLLADEIVDADVASRRLRYELDRHHLALQISSRTTETRGLERVAEELVEIAGLAGPLVVPATLATYDVWGASAEPIATAALAALASFTPPEGVRIAVGRPGHGIAGFRRSHAEARQAARVAAIAGTTAADVTTYDRVEVVSMLCGDLPRARDFVAGRLGPLAGDSEAMARLRETVLAVIVAGGSTSKVAKDLYLHQNTVGYRVRRAEELIGRRVTDDLVGIVTALTLADALGPAVLRAEDEPL